MRRVLPFYLPAVLIALVSCARNDVNVRFDEIRDPRPASALTDYPSLVRNTPFPIAGSPDAVKGGTLTLSIVQFPKTLNFFLLNYTHIANMYRLVYESLMETNPQTLEPTPLLARSFSISADKKEFTFHLDPDARWADGTPVTAEDVKFTYDLLMNPTNMTSLWRVSLRYLEPPVVVDSRTVVFRVKTDNWINFNTAYSFIVLPRHIYAGKNFNRDFNMILPCGSGPYRLAEVKKGRLIALERRPDYWGRNLAANFGRYNFDRIRFKSVMELISALNMVKKGDIDMMAVNTAKHWVTEFDIPPVAKNWLKKKKIYNDQPRGYQGLCFNLRQELFRDLRVRQAIACLIDQKTLVRTLMYGEYDLQNSYWPHIDGGNPANPYYRYAPDRARDLLSQAGWTKTDSEGYLVKDGRRFEFNILYNTKDLEKYFTIFIEEFRKVGIKANLDLVSFATYTKKMDDFQFDATWLAWGSSVFPEIESSWSSREADQKAGNNVPGLKDPGIDAIIGQYRLAYDVGTRNALLRKLDVILYSRMPYVLFWNADYTRMVYWDKFGHPEKPLLKYGDEYSILDYWWVSPEKTARLKKAIRSGADLPAEPVTEYYSPGLQKK